MPTIIVGARVAMGFAWASIIAAELAMGIKLGEGAQISIGLGQLMVNTLYVERDLNGLVGYMLTIGLIAILIDLVMRQFHRLALPAGAIP
jgi:ABC-type nitrate/sulfonate/bicarbonate transport system permease component